MAHFAKLDSNNIVTQVVVVNNDVLLYADNTESEYKGKVFLNSLLGSATWIQTSYNGSFRKQFASVGDTYDSTKDKFIKAQPYNSWTLDSNDDWQPPTAYPTDGKAYIWDEDSLAWVKPNSPYPSWTWNETEWEWEPPTDYPSDFNTQGYEWNENEETWDLVS